VLIACARAGTAPLLTTLREAAAADPRVPARARLLRDDFERRVSGTRIASGIGASIGVLTLLLACIGIFGVVSYGITLRRKEVGIHLALGAGRGSILRVVTRQVMWPAGIGTAAGIIAAAPISFALAQSPLQLGFADPVPYAMALAVLVASALIAAVMPALRAVHIDPIQALRHE
jgi:ABC-type antimicrobial peptide transport system permease subunit